jgi:hypothetical protein
MTPQTRVGGFKILKEVVWISLIAPGGDKGFPGKFCSLLAGEKINLPFLTCGNQDGAWGLNIVVEPDDSSKVSDLVERSFGNIMVLSHRAAILSIFPHKSNPEITGALFEAFTKEGVAPGALAHSNSAISVVLREEDIGKATKGLFTPFRFSAYRTPEDWKLAQKGKEKLYKEVVASYQEQRPKVYGLEYRNRQDLVQVKLNGKDVSYFGTTFKEFARLGLNLAFLATSPCEEKDKEMLTFCLPVSENHTYSGVINGIIPEADTSGLSPVGIFSMNGPHFGELWESYPPLNWNQPSR